MFIRLGYPHLDVSRNMSFALELQRMGKSEIGTRVQRAAEILGLSSLLSRYPRELSGGQRQRVAMGRAIVRDPDLFLFDEPLSNLDAKLRVHMRSEIKELHQRLGKTTVYVTHDQVEAMTMADKVVVMQGGVIEQIGAPLDLYDRPQNAFVAGFLGSPSMNFLGGIARDGGTRVEIGEWILPLGGRLPVADGTPVTVGLRPEAMIPVDPNAAATGTLQVGLVEPTGSETLVQGTMSGTKVQLLVRQRIPLKVGDVLHVSVAPDKIHVFDATSGTRLEVARGELPPDSWSAG